MPNALYPKWKEGLMNGDANAKITGNTVKAALVNTTAHGYVSTEQFYSSFSTASAVVGTPVALSSLTITNGVLNAASPTTFSSVSGSAVQAIILYIDTGTASTSPLIAFLDTVSAGLPVTPNGGNISVNWDTGANKIFAL